MTRNRIAAVAACVASGALPMTVGGVAWAQDASAEAQPAPEVEAEAEVPKDHVEIGPFVGLAVNIGGGIVDFTDDQVRDFSSLGGTWEARGILGSRSMWAVEAAYVGSAQNIDALGLDEDAVLMGTGLQALARFNFVQVPVVTPYAAIGFDWTHYAVSKADFNTSALSSSDDVFGIPIAVGALYHFEGTLEGLVFDIRASLRPTFDSDLIDPLSIPEDESARLDVWSATARLGWEF